MLQTDLLGCGDSCGDFADARWNLWKKDLALDYARDAVELTGAFVFWQPVSNGKAYLTQILRLWLATELLTGEAAVDAGTTLGDNASAKASGSTQATALRRNPGNRWLCNLA